MDPAYCPRCGAARPGEAAFCPACGSGYSVQDDQSRPVQLTAVLALVGGALAVVGAILPWASVSSGLFSVSKPGIEGDGIFTAAIGGIVALYGLIRVVQPRQATRIVRLALGISAAFIALVGISDFGNVVSVVGELDSNLAGSVGAGLYATIAAAVIVFVGSAAPAR